jgi:large subunit ribosomal protein L21
LDILMWRLLMNAVVKTGGKEYRIAKGDLIRVEKMEGKVGDQVTMKDILMISDEDKVQVGNPFLTNAVITGEIVQQVRGKKVLIYKMKRRKNYRRTKGHRQTYTYVRVNDISLA